MFATSCLRCAVPSQYGYALKSEKVGRADDDNVHKPKAGAFKQNVLSAVTASFTIVWAQAERFDLLLRRTV